MNGATCPACGAAGMEVFHRQHGVPVNSCLLVDTEAQAREFPRGDLELGFCPECGFIANVAFAPSLSEYSSRYEETQGFSPRFRDFARSLAQQWIDKYDIHGKDVLEIGCGKGEFLALMCELGDNRGVGVDPSAVPERLDSPAGDRIRLVPDLFGEQYADVPADVVVCRHTLEHIAPVREFMETVRRTIGERLDTVVLFELPDVLRVLREVAFWDVYYEHCSYFSMGSLARLFRRTGFEVLHLELAYDDQYILVEARPSAAPAPGEELPEEDDLDDLAKGVRTFGEGFESFVREWGRDLEAESAAGRRTVVWGGGSKAVSYLTTLGGDHVDVAVDINPYKADKYIAGTGHRVVSPSYLLEHPPDQVVAMNPVYLDEIRAELDRLGVGAALRAV